MDKLKKISALLGLLAAPLLLVHIGFNVYCYWTLAYLPGLKAVTAIPFIVVMCLHAVCAMISVFLLADGTRAGLYAKQNASTVAQRTTAALIFPLLILHLNTFSLLRSAASESRWLPFALLILAQLVFYAAVIFHTSLSFSRALVTLGLLSSPEKLKKVNRALLVLGALVFLAASFAIVKGQIAMIPMFRGEGAAP